MTVLNVFFDSQQFEEVTMALLAGQGEYRLPRQIIRNQYGAFQYVARLDTRDGEKGILVESKVNTYEYVKSEWRQATSNLEFVAFYPLSFIAQHKPLIGRYQEQSHVKLP